MNYSKLLRRGFTLIEVMLAATIIAIIGIVTVVNLQGLSNSDQLTATTNQITTSLRHAQSQAAQQAGNAVWGIHFFNGTSTPSFFAVFSGVSYASGTIQGQYPLSSALDFVSSTLAEGSSVDVTFSPISGEPVSAAGICLSLNNSASMITGIVVATSGLVDISNGSCYATWVGGAYLNQVTLNGSGRFTNGVGGMVIDPSGNFYITDIGANDVAIFNSSGGFQKTFGSFGGSDGQFTPTIRAAVVDSSDNVWVADGGGKRVEEFNSTGTFEAKFGSSGNGNGQFQSLSGISFDTTGNMWVTDGTRVEGFTETNGTTTYSTQFAINGSGRFTNGVGGMAMDTGGNFYITDIGASDVAVFNSSGVFVRTFGSFGATNGKFSSTIRGIVIDTTGNAWVVDAGNHRVEEFTTGGTYENQFGSTGGGNGQFSGMNAIMFDSAGNMWVTDATRLEEFTGEYTGVMP